jgi:hypothetical protein
MVTKPCLVITEPSWLDDYPGQVRWNIDAIEAESALPFKYHVARCENCGVEVLLAVEDPYLEASDGRIAVRFMGEYRVISDEVVTDDQAGAQEDGT